MNDGLLSQEEINALLNSDSDSAPSDTTESAPAPAVSTGSDVALTDNEKDALGEIGNISMGSAATTLSILLGKKVNITTPQVTTTAMDQLRSEYPLPYLVVAVDYTAGIKGSNLFAIKEKDALIIADLMMGNDGTNPPTELNELYMSAVSEAMNQMMGATSTSMSTMFKKKIDIAPPNISMVDFSNRDDNMGNFADDNPDPVVKISFRMEVEELIDSEIMQILGYETAKELVGYLLQPAETAPASPPTAAPSAAAASHAPAAQPAAPTPASAPSAPAVAAAPMFMPPPPSHQSMANVPVYSAQFAPIQPQAIPVMDGNIGLLMDVPMKVTVELGRTKKLIREILDLAPGSVVELDKLAGEPVDIFVNTKLMAKGEVVVIDENFGVRITEIVNPLERMGNLQ